MRSLRSGDSKVVCSSDEDKVTIVATGITVHNAIKAVKKLEENGGTLREAAQATGGRVSSWSRIIGRKAALGRP